MSIFSTELSLKIKQFLFSFLVIAAVIGLTLLFTIPKITYLFENKDKVRAQQEEIKSLQTKLNDLNSFSEAELSGSAEILLEALPAEKDFYLFLQNIKKVMTEEGLKPVSYELAVGLVSTDSAKPAKTKEEDSLLRMKVKYTGGILPANKVVAKMENSLPLMAIETMKVESEPATVSAEPAEGEGVIEIIGFFSPLPQKLGDIASPVPKMSSQEKTLFDKLKSFFRYPRVLVEEEAGMAVGKENPFP